MVPSLDSDCDKEWALAYRYTYMTDIRTSPAIDTPQALPERLTRDEDDELRRLHWFSQIGRLSLSKNERMLELRLRDRRKEIRPPREYAEEKVETTASGRRKWYKFGGH